jgi:drug/metabolite transporter (DMT)-like permease
MRRRKAHLSWQKMLVILLGAAGSLSFLMIQSDASVRWIWWVVAGGLVLVFGTAAYDKWRDDRN